MAYPVLPTYQASRKALPGVWLSEARKSNRLRL